MYVHTSNKKFLHFLIIIVRLAVILTQYCLIGLLLTTFRLIFLQAQQIN